MKLVKDEDGVRFLASRILVEYEIRAEALEVKSKNNISVATVKIVFQRRVQYYIASTFLQVYVFYFHHIRMARNSIYSGHFLFPWS